MEGVDFIVSNATEPFLEELGILTIVSFRIVSELFHELFPLILLPLIRLGFVGLIGTARAFSGIGGMGPTGLGDWIKHLCKLKWVVHVSQDTSRVIMA